jgi:tetratricopeptide (TPR) repeat protein
VTEGIQAAPEEISAQEARAEEPSREQDDLSLLDSELVKGLGGVVPAERKKGRVKVTLRDIIPEEESAKKEEEQPLQETGEQYYDLAKELGAALEGLEGTASDLFDEEESAEKSPEEMSFEEVFKEFKKGVEKKVPEEDFDTHYNLGIAYKEMELVEEAIGEFQIAAKSPIYFADACAMLGKCFQIKGMADLSEKWYRKGLDSKGFPEDVYNGLRYDLAELLETQGKNKDALAIYKEVYASNANYRDVKDKIDSLK